MTTRSQERKTVAELVSRDFENSSTENIQTENYVAGPSKSKIQSEKLGDIKTSLRNNFCPRLAENQKEN